MKTYIQQWGNSLALRIPKAFANQTKVKKGTAVSIALNKGRLVVTPLSVENMSLKKLASKITRQNRHAEIDTGVPRGIETW